jgi:flavin reductase (DIM6/NTAB) family NADH-FMN oxidoreductase RutF
MDITLNLEKTMQYLLPKGAFLTVKRGEKVNTMTIGWGFVGYMWRKPHFMVMVRPQRYTQSLLMYADSFTVSVPYGGLEDELRVCGTQSGKDIDKSKVVNFVPAKAVDSPVVAGCDMYYECKITYFDLMEARRVPVEVEKSMYNEDHHVFYFGEIVEFYEKQEDRK